MIKFNVTTHFSEEKIREKLAEAIEKKKAEVCYYLERIGEACVDSAKLNGSYTDQTGNLRSSIGYCVVNNGQIVSKGGFKKVKDGDTGVQKGEQYLDTIAQKYTSGIVLVVVAGMNYASYVADKGKDVLASAELTAENLVEQLLGGKAERINDN